MARQYLRSVNLIVGNELSTQIPNALSITDLRMTFHIEKDILGLPNRAKIQIWNLSKQTRLRIEKFFTKIILNAGYVGDTGLIFTGNITNVFHIREGVDIITEIYAADGFMAYKTGIFNKTYSPGASPISVTNDIIGSFPGITKGQILGIPSSSNNLMGATYSGSSVDVLNQHTREYSTRWTIQNEVLSIFPVMGSLSNVTRILSAVTGMIGSPTITEIGANAKVLLDREILPGSQFKIDSTMPQVRLGEYYFPNVSPTIGTGTYRVNKIIHSGDTHSDLWETQIEGFRVI